MVVLSRKVVTFGAAEHNSFVHLKSGEFIVQNLAAYSFKALLSEPDADSRFLSIEEEIRKWLKEKGVDDNASTEGRFVSLSGGGEGRFMRSETYSKIGAMIDVNLVELTDGGQYFTTNIKVIKDKDGVCVFSNLSVSNREDVITPQDIYPKCPKIIRKIITNHKDWCFGDNPVPNGNKRKCFGEKGGWFVCKRIGDQTRNFPIVVISVDPEEQVWPSLPAEIARDLVGIAHVFTVDEEASWVMTSELGGADSCYLGAVRLYWPVSGIARRKLPGKIWTPKQLRSVYGEERNGSKRFQSILRKQVMSAAALTITPPSIIRSILTNVISEKITEAERAAVDRELDSIVEENEKLRQELIEEKIKNSDLESKLLALEAALGKLEKLEESKRIKVKQNDEEDQASDIIKGDLIYYKKIGSGGGVDVLKRTGKCNHNESAWSPAFKGDQAEKGVHKLEGRNDWQSIQHCGACTGGGRWRVRW